jgi:magnesium transporter
MVTKYDATAAAAKLAETLASERPEQASQFVQELHPVDRAEFFTTLDRPQQDRFLTLLSASDLALLLEQLEGEDRAQIANQTPRYSLARVLDAMTSDDAADVLQTLPPDDTELVLANMRTAEVVRPLLGHAPDSAGGLMTRGYIALRPAMFVDETLPYLRSLRPLPEEAYYLYVLDDASRLLGVVNLRALVTANPRARLAEIMTKEIISVTPETDQEECVRIMQRYRLIALPVVGDGGVLQGIITSDDLLDVLSHEATEDMFKMAGVGVQEHAFSPILESATRRVPWLAFNMAWAFAGAFVISLFEGTLQKAAVIAVFMPMIAGQCGNAGIQTATIVVRSLALGELDGPVVFRLLGKEWTLSLIKGAIFGGILGLVAWLWKGEPVLGLIAGVAMALNMLVAGTTGVVLPLTLRRLGFDPATIAGVFDTMLTDLMGFVIYLGLATIFISYLT